MLFAVQQPPVVESQTFFMHQVSELGKTCVLQVLNLWHRQRRSPCFAPAGGRRSVCGQREGQPRWNLHTTVRYKRPFTQVRFESQNSCSAGADVRAFSLSVFGHNSCAAELGTPYRGRVRHPHFIGAPLAQALQQVPVVNTSARAADQIAPRAAADTHLEAMPLVQSCTQTIYAQQKHSKQTVNAQSTQQSKMGQQCARTAQRVHHQQSHGPHSRVFCPKWLPVACPA